MSRKVCCEVSSNISLFNLVSKDFCSLLGYFSNLHPSERILRNIISVLRKSVNEIWIGLLYFWNHSYWNWNKIQTTFLGHKKYKQSLLQKQDTNKVCCKNKIQTKFVAKYKIQAKFVAKTKSKQSLWQIQNTEIQVAKLDWEEHRTMCIEKCADILGKLLPHPCLKCPRFSKTKLVEVMFMVNYKCGVENCESLFKLSKVLKKNGWLRWCSW